MELKFKPSGATPENENTATFATMDKEEQLAFSANMFSVLTIQMVDWADNLIKSKKLLPIHKEKIAKFKNIAGVIERDVISPMFGKNLYDLQNMSDLVNLILAQQMSEDGLKRLVLIRAILSDEKLDIVDEKTHFIMPKKQKKQK